MTECSVEQGLCSVEHSCTMRSNWQRISVAVAGALQKVSLSEMSMPIHFDPGVLHIATLNMTEKRV
jgi:DNA-binding IscR family transcriptional regulator